MLKTLFLLCAGVLTAAGCSSSDGNSSGLLTGNAGAGAAAPSTAGNTSVAGSSTGASATAGNGTPIAGQGAGGTSTTTAGVGAAGRVGGSSGMAAAGSGPNTAGRGPAPAGMSGMAGATAGSGGMAAGAGAGAGGAGAAGSGGSKAPTVMVQFTTVSYGGEYAPLNYGAVWFERGSSGFLKTAKRWAGAAHATDLVAWTMASGGWGSIFGGGGNTADMMDAVSSATLRTHQTHMITWNMLDAQKQLVPDGEYVAVIEMSESRARDQAGPVVRIKFTKGPMPQMVMAPNEKSFTGISLRYAP